VGPWGGGIAVLLALLIVGSAGFALGRGSAGPAQGRSVRGSSVPEPEGGYAAGLKAGHAVGLAEGRGLQVAEELPAARRADVVAQFRAGYRAGADDVFSGYDGGWQLGRRYAVVLGPGVAGAAYRITDRAELP
jgi:hypothetical protein